MCYLLFGKSCLSLAQLQPRMASVGLGGFLKDQLQPPCAKLPIPKVATCCGVVLLFAVCSVGPVVIAPVGQWPTGVQHNTVQYSSLLAA